MNSEQYTLTALKDLMAFEERLLSNAKHLQQVRQEILLRWKVMLLFIACAWGISKWTQFIVASCLFYLFVFLFVILIGVSLRSGRLFSIDQYRQDVTGSLMPFNMAIKGDALSFNTKRVPEDLQRLLQAYRKEFQQRVNKSL